LTRFADLKTKRLHLIPATLASLEAEAADLRLLEAMLDARIPREWPPPLNDEDSRQFWMAFLRRDDANSGWVQWYIVRDEALKPRTVIGNGGFKGAPSADGVVEIGYSLFPEFQRQGYATEAVRGLLEWAFAHRDVQYVIAETLPDLHPSIAVLRRTGFVQVPESSEAGVLRFKKTRSS
jgi:RimJ/RimL family protein N-acetyltransferase